MPKEKKYLTVAQIAKECNVAKATVHHWIRKKKFFKAIKPSGKLLVAQSDFNKWMKTKGHIYLL